MQSGWQFGAFMCKALPYLQAVAVCASVNTLVVIAVDRYLAICHVMRQRNTKNMARVVLVVIWLVAFALMTPWALYFKMEMYVSQVQKIDMCVEVFPEVWQKKAFFLGVIFLMCYALPLAFIIACYFMIGYRVWHRDAPGITSSMGVIEKSKVRVVKMLVVVVVLFTVSWMPLYIIRLIILFADISESSPQSAIIHNIVFPFAQWLGTSNCCMNPLVYCLFSQKIRRRIRAMLCCSKPELRSLYSNRSMYSNALQHSTNTRDSTVRQEHTGSGYSNGHAGYGHHYGGGNLYHHRSARSDTEFIRLHRNSNVRSTHV
ncbi:neuropeptide SIFamide receptor-like [Aplysia californica]|uniref:Neuropeptide SIFamide receptor-like n=1 Tax=Aplysia californica TaxID=6500 RepID=A0ABM0ZX47_APLCA|nr:neuropeptide SIFamide receptor-like [Aplysia californica]